MDKPEAGSVGRLQRRRMRARGFSLIELLVVLAIMAILVSLVGPRLFSQVDKSKVNAARAQARTLKTTLDALRLDVGRYPTAEEGLQMLIAPPQTPPTGGVWLGPYLDTLPADPWGNAYIYLPPQQTAPGVVGSPQVISYGADGKAGGEGLDADIAL
ncbi:MAG: type II secretion system major pseudopilin GspG [Parvularculaceae bacterium]|nr:type II secretion system major pseudopilin GspG [Parvularculaceae bacterium]